MTDFYLMRMGSRHVPGVTDQILMMPMFGTDERVERCGESFWLRADFVKAIAAGVVKVPANGGLPRTTVETNTTCPRRMREAGPWEQKPGLDKWDKIGLDRVCSFCGSIHPDDLRLLLDDVSVTFDLATGKSYKLYLSRSHVPNASFGALKWYAWHGDQNLIDAVNMKLGRSSTAPI